MRSEHRSAILATCTVLLASLSQAQSSKPTSRPAANRPAATGEQAKQLAAVVERWEKLQYSAARQGLLTLSCKIEVASLGGMTGKWQATGTYTFGKGSDQSEPNGVLTWDDAEIKTAMDRRGWTAKTLAAEISHDAFRRASKDSQVLERPNGTIVMNPVGKAWVFDKKGVCVGAAAGPVKKRLYYKQVDGRFLRSGETYEIPKGKRGEPGVDGDIEVHYAKVSGLYVPSRIVEKVKVGERLQSHLVFTFEGHAVKAKAKKPPAKSKASQTTKPTSRRTPSRRTPR